MPQYLIKAGESFRDSDGSIKTGGQTIELDEQMAALHRDKLVETRAVSSTVDATASAVDATAAPATAVAQ